VERLNVKSSCLAESVQRAIVLFNQMGRQIIPERVQNAVRRTGLPTVSLEFVARMAAVHPVSWLIQAALRAGLEVVDGEFRPYLAFADSAVTATELKALPNRLCLVLPHRLVTGPWSTISGEDRGEFRVDRLPFGLGLGQEIAEPQR